MQTSRGSCLALTAVSGAWREWRDPRLVEGRSRGEARPDAIRVVGYASFAPQDAESPNGHLRRQAENIALACAQRGLSLLEIVREREPKRGHALERPGLGYALARISCGDADGLVVVELSRLSRSVPELGRVLEWFSRSDARLIAAAPGLDTEEQGGRLAARMIIDLSRWERERLVERTRNGMREARRKGPPGVADYPELRDRIVAMRAGGMTLQAISDQLNDEGVPTVRGGVKWRPSSVQAAAGYRRPPAPGTARLQAGGSGGDNGFPHSGVGQRESQAARCA